MNRVAMLLALLGCLVVGSPVAAQDPDLILTVADASVPLGGSADIPVLFDNTSTDDVDGWSYGVCHDPAVLEIADAVQGADAVSVNGGGPPGFESLAVLPGEGYAIGIVIDLFGINKLAPGTGFELSVGTYNGIAPGPTTQISICGTLGNPPVADVIVVGGGSISPTEIPSTVTIIEDFPFQFVASDETVVFDGLTGVAESGVTVLLGITDTDPNPGMRQTQAFSMGLRHDGTLLTPTASQPINSLADLNMGMGPDFFTENLNPANGPGYTLAVIYSLMGGVFIQFPAPENIVSVDYDVDATTLAAPMEPGNPTTVALQWDDTLGTPPVINLTAVAGLGQEPTFDNGSVFLSPIYGIPFIRGDCNDDGVLNIADTIWIVAQLFDNGPVGGCDAACDPNGDTLIDLSDAIYNFNYLFLMGATPTAPFPDCDNMPGEACDDYNSCP